MKWRILILFNHPTCPHETSLCPSSQLMLANFPPCLYSPTRQLLADYPKCTIFLLLCRNSSTAAPFYLNTRLLCICLENLYMLCRNPPRWSIHRGEFAHTSFVILIISFLFLSYSSIHCHLILDFTFRLYTSRGQG